MSERMRVAIIGCGSQAAHAHAQGYLDTGECELAAVADVRHDHAEEFAARYEGVQVYGDYQDMLEDERPEIVSICTGPRFQPSVVLDAASADVRAIHGELPLAPTWGEAKAMRKAAGQKGIQLTFNLAQRLLPSVGAARALLHAGRIGELQRLEGRSADLLDRGAQLLDLFHFFNGEASVEWVLGQLDSRTDRIVHGLPVEDRSLAEVRFRSGVVGLLRTGPDAEVRDELRLFGTLGVLELYGHEAGPRWRSSGDADWHPLEGLEPDDWGTVTARGIADLVQCLDTGDDPELSSERALRCTEPIFAVYESSRRRGRVELPLLTE